MAPERLLGRTFIIRPAGALVRVVGFAEGRVRLQGEAGARAWVPEALFFAVLHTGGLEECAEAPACR